MDVVMGDRPARARVDGAGGVVQVMGDVEVLDADVGGQTAAVDRGTSGNREIQPASHGDGVATALAGSCLDGVGVCPDHHAGVAEKRGGSRAEPHRCRALRAAVDT